MEYLFTYGTLQDKQVQQYVFGRILEGKTDALPKFKSFENAVYGRYPLVRPTGNTNDLVEGIAYEVNLDDLKRCDIYETSAYTRKIFTLKSGIKAWVYVKNG